MPFSKIFLFSCIAFIIGIFSALMLQKTQLILLGFLFLSLLGFSFLSRDRGIRWLIIFCLALFILGFIRGNFTLIEILNSGLQNFNGVQIVLEGIVSKEPEFVKGNQKLVIKIDKIIRGPASEAGEKILVYAPPCPRYHYSDRLRLSGVLEEPPIFDDFDYKSYLKRKGIFALVYEPKIEKLSSRESLYKKILNLREELSLRIEQSYSKEQAQLLEAMLLGKKNELSKELKEKLNFSGLRHLTAISGLHTVILINALMYLFLAIGLWRKQALLATAVFIFIFLMLTGFQISAIRASIMALLLFSAQLFGRLASPERVIVFAALLMLFINPYLFLEIGFQLSFLAVIGISYFSPLFRDWFKNLPELWGLKEVFIITLCAQITTLPILVYNFGYFSLLAIISNLLILPILPFVLILGFLSLLFKPFSFFCYFLLAYFLEVIDFFSKLSFSVLHLKIGWIFIILFYCLLLYLLVSFKRKNKFRYAGF